MTTPTFFTYRDNAGEYRWYLRDTNNEKIADSAEGYTSEWSCERAIKNVIEACRNAQIINR